MNDVIDTAFTYLLESKANIEDACGEFDPETIQPIPNTSVVGFRYWTSAESKSR